MNIVEVSCETEEYSSRIPECFVADVLQKIMTRLNIDGQELSCTFVSDDTMKQLNQDFRGINEPTDILSFAQSDGSNEFPDATGFIGTPDSLQQGPILGDIVISPDALDRNCDEFSVEPREELIRLLVHGCLHLIGEDHETNEPSQPMLVMQEQLVSQLLKELQQ